MVYVPNGTYVYDTSFFVDTNNYYGFELNFKWAADDNVNIVLNSSTVASGGSWSLIGPAIVNTFTPLIANATNHLKATLDNIPIGYSPTGLLVVGQLPACRKPPVEPACITIVKDALPDDPQDFNFTWNASPFVLDDDSTLPNPSATPNSKTLCDLSPGATHIITEAPLPPGWTLAGIACSQSPPGWATVVIGPNPPATFNSGDNTVSITLPALLPSGAHVTCIFSDRKIDRPGCITIIKDRKPNSPEDYLFQGAPWPGLFTLDDDPSSSTTPNSATLCDLTANGTYAITELGAVPPPPPQQQAYPTAVVNIVCTVSPATFATVVFLPSGSTTYQPGDNGVKITVGPQTTNGNVTCIFVNAPIFPSLLGDLTCNGTVDTMDMLKGLKYLAGVNMPMDPTSEGACPWIGSTVLDVADELMLWGDENCDGMVDTMDTLMELQALAGLPYSAEGDPQGGYGCNLTSRLLVNRGAIGRF